MLSRLTRFHLYFGKIVAEENVKSVFMYSSTAAIILGRERCTGKVQNRERLFERIGYCKHRNNAFKAALCLGLCFDTGQHPDPPQSREGPDRCAHI